ncbi:carbamoyltransferase family protein [Blastomonas aquatica]|uniref:Carbamoyltransferase n=1 Tax=Blastomonas aquatica TaxID=1510276 RepID=A0ABQ1J113_9SPHN|nr:carbamoyltransferase [Blastomonas aquatica]GGB55126.1 carbamoyltransferase [Blastomonas aquatica]
MTSILGISALYHDSAAALVTDGRIVAAAQEERFTRVKQDASFPANAIQYVLAEAGISGSQIDHIVFYEKPFLKFERLLDTYFAFAPSGFRSFREAMPIWGREKLFQRRLLGKALGRIDPAMGDPEKLRFSDHHLSHAASAFYPSPFESAAVLTMDGVGEWTTTSAGVGSGSDLRIDRELRFPHSLGLLYAAFTYHAGFKVNSGEYKLMGLAPYGEPRFAQRILDNLIDLREDGSFHLDQRYFNYCTGLTMTNARFDALFGRERREPESPFEQFHADMAASIQQVTELAVVRMARDLARRTGENNLCLAGGVALNCVANGKLIADGAFENIWIQPAAGDAGGALGAALAYWHLELGGERPQPEAHAMRHAYLGPGYSGSETQTALDAAGARYELLTDDLVVDRTAQALKAGKAVGWFQGRSEFGPRALGNRSILADPRAPDMQRRLNLKIKFRESFRPFAPAVLAEDAGDWFDLGEESPFMLITAPVAQAHRTAHAEHRRDLAHGLNTPLSDIPAVTHVDFSARVQTVTADDNPRFHSLLLAFKAHTGCPVLANTSFNVRGEPIVQSPADAFRCFMGTGLDVLVVGNCIMEKHQQDTKLAQSYAEEVPLD